MGYFQVRYNSRIVNYDRRGFIRLATDWAIYCTLGNFSKPVATIFLPKSPLFLQTFIDIWRFFFWSHCQVVRSRSSVCGQEMQRNTFRKYLLFSPFARNENSLLPFQLETTNILNNKMIITAQQITADVIQPCKLVIKCRTSVINVLNLCDHIIIH